MATSTSSDSDKTYENNLRQAREGTDAWVKVKELASTVNHQELARLLQSYKPHQLQHLSIRTIDNPLGTMCVPTPFAAVYKVVRAIRHDGSQVEVTFPDPNEPTVAYCCIPEYGMAVPLKIQDEIIVSEGQYASFTICGDDVKELIVARLPRLRTADDPEMERYDRNLRIEDFSPGSTIFADRKERKCAGCGVEWRKTMPRCTKCLKARFCSQACLIQAWPEHKHECRAHRKK